MNIEHSASLDDVLTAYADASGGGFNAILLDYYIQRFPHFRDNLNRYAQVQLSSVRATWAEINAAGQEDGDAPSL